MLRAALPLGLAILCSAALIAVDIVWTHDPNAFSVRWIMLLNSVLSMTSLACFVWAAIARVRQGSPTNAQMFVSVRAVLSLIAIIVLANALAVYWCGYTVCFFTFALNVAAIVSWTVARSVSRARSRRS
jgi:hypothetical protein